MLSLQHFAGAWMKNLFNPEERLVIRTLPWEQHPGLLLLEAETFSFKCFSVLFPHLYLFGCSCILINTNGNAVCWCFPGFFSVSRVLLETVILKELLRSFWSHSGFGFWHLFKVSRINCGNGVLNSVPNTSNFLLWVCRLLNCRFSLSGRYRKTGNNIAFPSFHNGREVQPEILSFRGVTIKLSTCFREYESLTILMMIQQHFFHSLLYSFSFNVIKE